MQQWFKEKPNEPRTKGYKEFRTLVDKLTCNMCTKYPEIEQRKEKGAEIYKVTTPDSEAEISISEESMSEGESMSISEEKTGTMIATYPVPTILKSAGTLMSVNNKKRNKNQRASAP